MAVQKLRIPAPQRLARNLLKRNEARNGAGLLGPPTNTLGGHFRTTASDLPCSLRRCRGGAARSRRRFAFARQEPVMTVSDPSPATTDPMRRRLLAAAAA
ncbi:hypothetical protein Q6272_28265, partial [Klebsiella pneumoniae]|nr:hypothetical protein [Klebsiella pneumoniae]